MIENTRIKFDKTNEHVRNTLASVNLSEEVLNSTEIEASLNRLNNGVFRIAVVAPFSAGKSTFINSLLGFDLLSTSILVETAAITTVKYSESPRAEINYYDGSQIVIDGNKNELVEFKAEIKRYTTVNRSEDEFEVESSIQSVDVFWPIELCKSGVEIVDTPGLFALHESHSGITSNILNSVNAVIFIIDPTTVGEVNFMKVIREYVDNAKLTTIDNSDKHIFFAVNKIDQYPEAEVEKAFQELRKVLDGVVMAPKIFRVSSYLGLVTKMYEQGYLNINDLRRDETVKYVDEEGFPVSGRQLQETDVQKIKKISNIESVYESLGIYFEEKNGYLISEVFQKLNRAIELELDALMKAIEIEKIKHNEDSGELKRKSEILTQKFKEQITLLRENIEDLIEDRINNQSSSKSIMHKIRKLFNTDIFDVLEVLQSEINREWRSSKKIVKKGNAAEVLENFFKLVDLKIENTKHQVNQKTFAIITKEIKRIVNEFEELVNEMELNFNRTFEMELGISQFKNSFFNFDELLEELKQEIEAKFKGNTALEIKGVIEENLSGIESENTVKKRAPGVFNYFKSWFGKETYVTEFQLEDFVNGIEKEVKVALEVLEENVESDLRKISGKVYEVLGNDIPDFIIDHLLDVRIKNYTTWQQNQLNSLTKTQKQSNEQYKHMVEELSSKQLTLIEAMKNNSRLYTEIINTDERELVL